MDLGILVIFLIGGSWLYASSLLALADWRWNLGRVTAFGLLAAAAAWPAFAGGAGAPWLAAMGLLFVLTILLPRAAARRARTALLRGNDPAAFRWETLRALLSFQSLSAARERLLETRRLLRHEWTGMGRSERALWLLRVQSAWSRRAFLSAWIEGLVHVRENETATRLFEEHFGPGKSRADPNLLYLMVGAYAKLGVPRRALDALRRADAARSPGASLNRAAALLHLFAFAGRPRAVDRLIARDILLQATVPPSYVALWRGVALMRQGDPEAAREAVESARDRQPAGDPRFDGMLRRIRAMMAEPDGARALDPALERDLDELEAGLEAARPEPLPLAPPRLIATPAIMIACAAMWLAMETRGSSLDPILLIRFGANVPGLVSTGEWWRLVTSIFLHVGLLHLVFNMWACQIFGSFVERLSGRWSVFVAFMLSGIAGSAASAFIGAHAISAGASGGVFGLLGMAIVLTVSGRGRAFGELRRMQLFTFLFFAAINAVYGVMQPQVDNLAHAGGFAGGLMVGALVRTVGDSRRRALFLRAAGVGLLLLSAVVASDLAANLRGGGYPRRIASWRSYVSPGRQWTLEVPAVWNVSEEGSRRVLFRGPLDAGFEVVSFPGVAVPYRPEPGAAVMKHSTVRAHGMEYEEWVLVARERGAAAKAEARTDVAQFIFRIETGGGTVIMALRCEEELLGSYRNLAERLPLTFRLLNAGAGAAPEAPASAPPASEPPPQ
jgi:membrane associated rhomboid family serine protease